MIRGRRIATVVSKLPMASFPFGVPSSIAERRAREAIVTACVAAVEHALPVVVTYRAARKPPLPMHMVLTHVRTDLDPPRVMGYQLPGRGRRELRADRILRVDPSSEDGPSR